MSNGSVLTQVLKLTKNSDNIGEEIDFRGRSSSDNNEDNSKNKLVLSKKSISNISIPSALELESQTEEDLWATWNVLLHNWDTVYSKRKSRTHLEALVRRGIPPLMRPVVWKNLVQTDTKLLTQSYPSLINSETPFDKQIIRDSTRTFPTHEMFMSPESQGVESLRNLMHAYAVYDKEVGYCQGLGFVAGLLLMTMPEEEAFCVLIQILQENRIRDMYKPSMSLLSICNYQLDKLIEESHPHVYYHLKHQGFSCSLYASTWFLTLFSTMIPLHTIFRIMDVYLIEGLTIIFQVALALIDMAQTDLIDLEMEGLQHFLTGELGEKYGTDADVLIKRATSIELDKRKLKRWEKEYIRKKERELQDRKEIIHFKNENKSLAERVMILEKENTSFSNQLIDKQLLRAKEAEETLKLKSELSKLRKQTTSKGSSPNRVREEIDIENDSLQDLIHSLATLKVHLAEKANKIEQFTLELRNTRNENTKLRSALLEAHQELHKFRKNVSLSTSHIGSQLSLDSYEEDLYHTYSGNDSKIDNIERELNEYKKCDHLNVPHLYPEVVSNASSRSSLQAIDNELDEYNENTSLQSSRMNNLTISHTKKHSRSLEAIK